MTSLVITGFIKMKITKTKLEKRVEKKTNKELAKLINQIKKINIECARYLALPSRSSLELNLDEIDKKTKEGDKVLIPGKVLGSGIVTKKIKIVALKFSGNSLKRLRESNCESILLTEEIKKNPELKDLKLLT